MDHDEIYLIDLWRVFRREWRWFAAALLLVLCCTFVFTRSLKNQWEATAWMQIGQVGQVPAGQDPKAEPLLRVLERVQTIPFQNDVAHAVGYGPDTAEARLYRRSLKADPSPYANLIKLTVRAATPALATQLATATVGELHALHQRIEAVPLQAARASLDEVDVALRLALADRDRLASLVATSAKDPAPMASLVLANKNQEVRMLQQNRSDLATRLSANYTFETSLLWPVYVPDRPASPNPPLLWGVGVLLGLVAGAFAALARHASRRARPA